MTQPQPITAQKAMHSAISVRFGKGRDAPRRLMAGNIPAKYRDRQKNTFRHCGEGMGHFFRHMAFIFAFGDVANG